MQEHSTEIGLQLLDCPAQRRLTHVQPGRRATEMTLLSDNHRSLRYL
jgi:hypothetical protein